MIKEFGTEEKLNKTKLSKILNKTMRKNSKV